MTRTEFMKVMARVSMLWPNSTVTADQMRAAEPFLLPLDAGILDAVVDQFVREEREFAPNTSLMYGRALALIGGGLPGADEAWEEARRQIQVCGRSRWLPGGRTPEWSHVVIGETVEAFGWNALCDSDNEVADRAHFLSMYRERAARIQRSEPGLPMVGSGAPMLALKRVDDE